ncbi:helix-turn-helix domain-containing protein [Tissierella pigra]|uniref:Helix-turn-helix transcriptional regulator n=1 Tax=Tissierella pigra TaxID=2607614 RepID=A0A6N7XEJ3_9FIRM|nr:AraC family transcriptional regulator [Tissierella pigra]MSU00491.1 helix-turn-helix transcriptional regulator [Tissierella pigra]
MISNNLFYPKPNRDDFYNIYEFEIDLIREVSNGNLQKALKLYDEFFSRKFIYNVIENNSLEYVKSYIISISLLICHNVIRKGVSAYSAKAKYHAFLNLIEKSTTKEDTLNTGKQLIHGYIRQLIKISNPIDNIYIRKAVDYIQDNLGEDLTLSMVADHIGLSKCYFCSQFKKELDMSFTEYLAYARIEKSKYLLCNSDKSILDIAILIGFNSQSYFSAQFKKYTGISPKEFRNKRFDSDYLF